MISTFYNKSIKKLINRIIMQTFVSILNSVADTDDYVFYYNPKFNERSYSKDY